MRIFASIVLILGLALYVHCETTEEGNQEEDGVGLLDCMFASNTGSCLRSRLSRDLDQIELEVTGKKSEPPLSTVVAQAGNIIAEIVDDLQENGAEGIIEDDAQDDNVGKDQKSNNKIITSMRNEIILFLSTYLFHYFYFN